MAVKMNKTYCGDGFPNLPDFNDLGSGDYTAGDGIAISDAGAISASLGDGMAVDANKKIIPSLGDGLTTNASHEIVPDVDGTTISVNETSHKLECVPSVIYSGTERLIGKWLNDEDLYEVTKTFTGITPGQANEVAHGISNVDHIFATMVTCEYGSGGEILMLPYVSSNTLYQIMFSNITTTQFTINPGSGFQSISNLTVTFRYTKTTTP